MHSYHHHINDFDSATRHLNRLERGLYRDMLDLYYKTESPLIDDLPKLCRLICADFNECSTAVETLLNDFFHKTEKGWAQVRCELEIDAYRNNSTQKSIAGKASAAKRAAKRAEIINGRSTSVQQPLKSVATEAQQNPTNQEPVTLNQEPRTNNQLKDNTCSVESTKKPAQKKPESWKAFFDLYPENKKGGTDTAAWAAAKRNGLNEEDFEAMVADVSSRRRLSASWYSTYALGICKYINERFWLTPVVPDLLPKTKFMQSVAASDQQGFLTDSKPTYDDGDFIEGELFNG